MRRYVAVRVASLVPILFGVSLLVFAMQALVPGDIVDFMMGGDQAFAAVSGQSSIFWLLTFVCLELVASSSVRGRRRTADFQTAAFRKTAAFR